MEVLPHFKWLTLNYPFHINGLFSNQNKNVNVLISFETISSEKDRVEKGAALAGFKRCLDACLILKSPVMISSRSVRRRSSRAASLRLRAAAAPRSNPTTDGLRRGPFRSLLLRSDVHRCGYVSSLQSVNAELSPKTTK